MYRSEGFIPSPSAIASMVSDAWRNPEAPEGLAPFSDAFRWPIDRATSGWIVRRSDASLGGTHESDHVTAAPNAAIRSERNEGGHDVPSL